MKNLFETYCPKEAASVLRWAATGMNCGGDWRSSVIAAAVRVITADDPNVFLRFDARISEAIRESEQGYLTQTLVSKALEGF